MPNRGLFEVDMDDADLRKDAVPVLGHGVEDQTKILFIARLQGSRRERLDVNIRISRADDFQRLGFVLRHFVSGVAKQHLHRDSRHGPAALIHDLAIEVGHLAAGQIRRLAHGQVAKREVARVGIDRRRDRRHRRRAFSVLIDQHHSAGHSQYDGRGHRKRQPVAIFRSCGTDELRACAHEPDCTTPPPQIGAVIVMQAVIKLDSAARVTLAFGIAATFPLHPRRAGKFLFNSHLFARILLATPKSNRGRDKSMGANRRTSTHNVTQNSTNPI